MRCEYPITLNREKNHILPARNDFVPCGKCIPCIERIRASWSFRIAVEEKESESSTFLTLTYSDDFLPKNNQLSKSEIQKYIKRLRHKAPNLKYYFVGEYGENYQRPHYHAIIFNVSKDDLIDEWTEKGIPKGIVTTDIVSPASIHYVTGYVNKKYGKLDEKTGKQITEIEKLRSFDLMSIGKQTTEIERLRSFALMSKGLGKKYIKYAAKFHKSNLTLQSNLNGNQTTIPRYYRDNIFTDDELHYIKSKQLDQVDKYNEEFDYFKETDQKKHRIHKQIQTNKNKKL